MTRGLRDGLSLITSRPCERAFPDREVPRGVLAEMLFAAGHAPSSRNTQMEMGLFPQNVMLGPVAKGLRSCPRFSVAGYGDVLRAKLGIDPARLVVCTMAVGHADETAPVNRFVPQRAGLEEYVQWRE
ncbi:hypothetical protein ACWCRF_30790 [Streptomyces sp. NPDC002405]